MNANRPNVVDRLPCEICVIIFKLLDLKTLAACRVVCSRWHQIIDYDIALNENLWRKRCETNYGDICHSAHANSTPGLTWYQLFKTLTLWARIPKARETKIKFLETKLTRIVDFEVCFKGKLNILTRNSIMYYHVKTLTPYREIFVNENCTKYYENDDIVLLLNEKGELNIIDKDTSDNKGKFKGVYEILVLSNVVYYVTAGNELYKCTLVDGSYSSTFLTQFSGTVLSLGHENNIIHALTTGIGSCYVYSFANNVQTSVRLDGSCRAIFQTLTRYDFINHTNWDMFFDTVNAAFNEDSEQSHFDLLQILHIHGPVLFAGYNPGVIRIFYSLYSTDVVDLLKATPLRVCNLYKVPEAPLNYAFLNIGVVEGKNNHTVLVAMLKKVVAIKFTFPVSRDEMQTCSGCDGPLNICRTQPNCYRRRSISWGEKNVVAKQYTKSKSIRGLAHDSYEEPSNNTEVSSSSRVETLTKSKESLTSSRESSSSGKSSSGEVSSSGKEPPPKVKKMSG